MTAQVPEPAIVSYGRQHIGKYPASEYRATLVRSFRQHGADYIVLDSNPRGMKFLSACTAWAIDQGLLYCAGSDDDGQQVVSEFRLTDAGKREILSGA